MTNYTVDAGIIAGGLGTRLDGADKGLLEWGKQRFAEHIAAKLRPNTQQLIINCNRNLPRYGVMADVLVHDETQNYAGPLAGLLSILKGSDADYVLTSPCDTPLLPDCYATRMTSTLSKNPNRLIVAHDGKRIQPLHLLLPKALELSLQKSLDENKLKLTAWIVSENPVFCYFDDMAEGFLNVNSPQEFNQLLGRDIPPTNS